MKQFMKRVAGYGAQMTGVGRPPKGTALILMLHRVLPDEDFLGLPFQQVLALSKTGLDTFLGFCRAHFVLIQLDDFLQLDDSERESERFLCLTFDDGWQDNYDHALPLLHKHGAPASVYLSTDFIGTNRTFWWQSLGDMHTAACRYHNADSRWVSLLRAHGIFNSSLEADELIGLVKALPQRAQDAFMHDASCLFPDERARHALTWAQVRDMSSTGLIRFGSHGITHRRLIQLNADEVWQEISSSRDALVSQDGVAFNNIFCYPNGDRTTEHAAWVAQAGYGAALTTEAGFAYTSPTARYHLPRINLTDKLARNPALFWYRLATIGLRPREI